MNPETKEYMQKLLSFGVHLRDSWINQVKFENFQSFEEFLKEFLFADIEQTAEPDPFLIENFQKSQYCITKPITVQIDEIIDISLSDTDRLHDCKSQNPTLKVLINSGGFRIAGVLQDQVQNLDLDTEPGMKMIIKPGACLVYGVLIICEDNVVILGGNSPQLIEKRDQMIKSRSRISAFQNIEELFDVIPEIKFGLNPTYVFQDFTSKRNPKNGKTILQTPMQIMDQSIHKEEAIAQSMQNPKSEPSLRHSTPLESNTNMPVFKPIKQSKMPNASAKRPNEKANYQNPIFQSTKPILLSASSYPLKQNLIAKANQESNPTNPSINVSDSANQSGIIELGQLLEKPRSQTEALYSVNAHIESLSLNNLSTFAKGKKKISPFIVTLESNTNRQKVKISIDPLFLQLLFNLDYIDNLSQEDLIGTMRICEKKIKDMLSPPLSVIDKGRGRPYDRFFLTK